VKYDCIVIGAGNGGLVSALTLQKSGKKVLVLEAHNLPGGYATSFVRGRFEFEASLHELCEYGTKEQHGAVYDLFSRLGIQDQVEFVQVPECFHVISLDTKEEYTLPFGVDAFIQKMEEYVPGSKESVTEFFELVDEVKHALQYFNDSKGRPEREILINEFPNFMKVAPYSVDKVLDKLKMPKKAQEILTTYWIYLGSPTKDLSFVHFALMLYSYVLNGAWIPKERSHAISSSLVEEFEAKGGTIRYLSQVQEILFQDNYVSGVKCRDGSIYYADQIISNVSPTKFYGSLVPNEYRTKKMKQYCNARTLGAQGFCVYLGLNKSAKELGLDHYSYFIYHSLNSNIEYKHMEELYHDSLVAVVLDESMGSPLNTTTLCLTSLYFGDAFSKEVNEANYFRVKNEIASQLIQAFSEATGVSIQDAIEEIEIATPVTFARYGGHPNGTIYGYLAKGYDNLVPRLMSYQVEDYLANVHFCGGFSTRLSGFSSSYLSGEMAAKQTLQDLKKRGENHEEHQNER